METREHIQQQMNQYPYVQAFKLLAVQEEMETTGSATEQSLHGAALYMPQPAFLSLSIQSQVAQPIHREYTVTEKPPFVDNQTQPSRYHDDLMPFSFLWWLHKTRIEYSDTYQPYRSDMGRRAFVSKDNNEPDVIDQQIKENIFHLQSPEALLGEAQARNTIAFEVSKNENPVIERFIKEEPQIKPPSPAKINLENKARKSAEDNSGFVSETLAQIYTEQGLYLKAIDTYKKLSLKFPEKSPYFAELIKELNSKVI